MSSKEKIYVLYGSQTGNSELAAVELCQQLRAKLPNCEGVHMQLDDFLELEGCSWTRLVVIITSSYGVGQAPLGCYRFRELCEEWKNMYNQSSPEKNPKPLKGVYYALCGLGDSKYTTFFRNPTVIDESLRLVGAERVGPIGKADASGTGEEEQNKVIERWIDGIWPYLKEVVAKERLSDETLKAMQDHTVEICRKINPDFAPAKSSLSSSGFNLPVIAILVALIAVVAYFYATV